MAKFVKLTGQNGETAFVNPDAVLFVTSPPPPHDKIVGLAGVTFQNNMTMVVKGVPMSIIETLTKGPFLERTLQ